MSVSLAGIVPDPGKFRGDPIASCGIKNNHRMQTYARVINTTEAFCGQVCCDIMTRCCLCAHHYGNTYIADNRILMYVINTGDTSTIVYSGPGHGLRWVNGIV